jgi:hypothetical protein
MSEQGERGDKGEKGDKGKEGHTSIFPWIFLVLTFIVMGVILTHDYRQTNKLNKDNRSSIGELQRTKVNIHQLQKSNCTLRIFLATARQARYAATKTEIGARKVIDIKAVAAYTNLIVALDGKSYCPLPKHLIIPGFQN